MISKFCSYLINNDEFNAEKIFDESAKDLSVIETLIVPALVDVGELWEQNEISLSQIYLSSKIVERLVNKILPAESLQRINQPKIAIAALEDYHLLGKSIVISILKASGYSLKDYGRVSIDELKNLIIINDIDFLLLSTLMLPSALNVKEITEFIQSSELNIKVVVGGAPFNFDPNLANEVGADYYCEKASDILDVINEIMGGSA